MTLNMKISKNVLYDLSTKAGKITSATDQKGKNYLAKIIMIQQSQDLGYSQSIEFNKQIFGDLEDFTFKDHLLQIITEIKDTEMLVFITQPYETNLEKYIRSNKITEKQAKIIFAQILKAIYSIVINGYWHRNIRVQHFVKVKDKWKLQSLVFDEDYSKCGDKYNQYLWNPRYEAPEYNPKKKNYTDDDYNLMTVWNLGCILLQLLTINHKLSTRESMDKFKGQEFTMEAIGIGNNISQKFSKEIRQILGSMLHHDPKKRMTLSALFQNPYFSEEVSKHALINKKIPPSKIASCQSSVRSSNLSFQNELTLKQIHKTVKEQQKAQQKIFKSSKIGIDDEDDFISNLKQISYQLPKQVVNKPQTLPKQTNIEDLMNNKNHPTRKALQIYKSYFDQSQLLLLSSEQIIRIDFMTTKTQSQIREIRFLNKYAIVLVSLINLNALAEGFNKNQNILSLDGDLFVSFQGSNQYTTFQKFVNFKRNQRQKLLEQIKKEFMMTKHKKLINQNQNISNLLSRDYKKTNFQDIKAAYRFIVKFAYDAISQQYNRNKLTDSASSLAKIAMYVTYALTIDKLYIIEDIADNFKYYFQWHKKAVCSYVPLNEFKKYIEQAPKDILIENSRFILKKYYNI